MEEQDNDNDYVLVFDHFYTNNHIQIMKTLLPYIDSAAMPMLPVMIKYMELQYTMKLVRKNTRPEAPVLSACSKDSPDIETIYQSIRKYLAPEEEKSFQQIIQLMHTMDNVRQMQKMMEMLQTISGDGENANAFPDMSALEGMFDSGTNMNDIINMMKAMK